MRRALLVLVAVGCSSKAPEAKTCPAGTTPLDDACAPTLDDCDERSVPKPDGGCTQVGVIDCAPGFSSDGAGGCAPILPEAPCMPGTRALPGETACSALVDCGTDPYGSPPGAHVLYVDASAPGGGDGSRENPFGAFGNAFDAAKDGDTIAFAAGEYQSGSVTKAVTLWGRCPQLVSFVGSAGSGVAAIHLAAKVKLARVAITGDGVGLGVDGAQGVEIEDVWIHDLAEDGVWVQAPHTDSSITFRNVLVEHVNDTGIGIYGSQAVIERTVVRDVGPGTTRERGVCVSIESNIDRKKPSTANVRNGLFERCHDSGITVFGSDATIETSLIRDIQPQARDKKWGSGVTVLPDADIGRASSATLRDLVVTNTFAAGVFAQSSTRVERCTVTDTKPQVADKSVGSAVYGAQGASVEIFDSFLARNHHIAVLLTGNGHLERTIVRDVTPDDTGVGGVGIVDIPVRPDAKLVLDVVDSAVLHTQGGAIAFIGSTGSVRGSHVRDVSPGTGGYGDAITAESIADKSNSIWLAADVRVENTLIMQATRAGGFAFGGCRMTFAGSALRCNGIDLAISSARSEDRSLDDALGVVEDEGGNLCGCGSATLCHATPSDLVPVHFSP